VKNLVPDLDKVGMFEEDKNLSIVFIVDPMRSYRVRALS